ncbi:MULTISPECIES: hypothetical protein [unclassified Bradyrhizobium]|uniref:hypothetical protein n=1 Tax=unclassified Bradyrhizobium TaxID=2631580 RepID=UPI002FEEA0A6
MEALILVAESGGPTMLARIGVIQIRSQKSSLGQAQTEERPMTVFVYIDTSKQVGDPEHIKVFATGCCFPIPTSGERNG